MIVDDTPRSLGGSQCIVTCEGYVVPLHVCQGLPYMPMSVPSAGDMDALPHVFFCADTPWDPEILDNEFDTESFEAPAAATERRETLDGRVHVHGDLDHAALSVNDTVTAIVSYMTNTAVSVFEKMVMSLSAFPQRVIPNRMPDLDALRPNLGFIPVDRIKRTLEETTQFYRATIHHPFRKHYKSRFPAANVTRLMEWYSTDTIFSDEPAFDDGVPGHGGTTMFQIYGGCDSHFLAGYPMKTEKAVPSTLEDFIRDHGAMQGLVSDNAKSETSNAMHNIFRLYNIKDRQSEPHYEHQNPIERRIQDVKRMARNIMDHVGCPAGYWLLCTLFVISLLNCLVNANGAIPQSLVTGQVTDISPFLSFHFWQEVFFEEPDKSERLGRWVGVAPKQGDFLTYKVLTSDTKRVVTRSNVRPAKDPLFPNRRERQRNGPILNDDPGEVKDGPVLYSLADKLGVDESLIEIPKFSPEDLLGLTFLKETPDGEKLRAKVTRKIMDRDAENHQNIKFLINCGDDAYEEIIAYNELSDIIDRQHQAEADGEQDVYTFVDILDHDGPLTKQSPNYKESLYNVRVRWTDGSETWEPVNMMQKDDPVTLANYAKKNDLLDTPGWKICRRHARRAKKLQRMLNQTRRQSKSYAPRYKFGVLVPRDVKAAYAMDRDNGNDLWRRAMKTEIDQLFEYETFHDIGRDKPPPAGHQMIRCRMIFDVKEDGRRKARFVAGGHLTSPSSESCYSSVVSLCSLRIVSLIAELNDLKLMAADVGNAYLEAKTSEKVCFIAGPEFGDLAGHTFVIFKALYGLRSSGSRYHEKFADTLTGLGFKPSYADPDVWIRDAGGFYEYVCVYVDDLLVAMKNPQAFMDLLQSAPHNYKLKGVGDPRYHLGGDFFRDPDGCLCYSAQTYVKRLIVNYTQMFGEPPKSYMSPLAKGDHPELDLTELSGLADVVKFQSLIGALQWTILLGRSDIANAVMTLGRYRSAPTVGHLERAKRIVGYLKKFPHATIRFCTGIPNHESVYGENAESHDWMYSVYGNPKEDLPPNAPVPMGKPMRTTTFVDANLMHNYSTGRLVTGVLHLLNQTPIAWFSKRQGQVKTATYGSEFVAARTAVEQIIDLRYTLRMLGVALDGPSWLFGDNQSVITSSTLPHSTLSKHWNALSYHRVHKAVAAGFVRFRFVDSKENPFDIFDQAFGSCKCMAAY